MQKMSITVKTSLIVDYDYYNFYPARALRALGLLLYSRKGEDFLTGQLNFFYENSCNSGTKSRKIVPKVGN